uniref:Secreted protein n=1 Tax=Octopus bimaculoides TaxID=37653 RepID=A0A0L8G1J6_OCTBM
MLFFVFLKMLVACLVASSIVANLTSIVPNFLPPPMHVASFTISPRHSSTSASVTTLILQASTARARYTTVLRIPLSLVSFGGDNLYESPSTSIKFPTPLTSSNNNSTKKITIETTYSNSHSFHRATFTTPGDVTPLCSSTGAPTFLPARRLLYVFIDT